MPSYENPQPRQDVNYSRESPLKEFSQLLIGVALLATVAVVSLSFLTGYLSRFIPFEFERSMVSDIEFSQIIESPQQQYLQTLAETLANNMDLPDDMQLTVHYRNSDTVNAFATVGGHIVFFQGLLDELESEQELATVMAHGIAHIQHRHPIVALGKGVTIGTLAAVISGASGSNAGDWLIGSSVQLNRLQFSRSQEEQADSTAAQALFRLYGSVYGAQGLFKKFSALEQEQSGSSINIEMFRSHPYSSERWQRLKQLAELNNWPVTGAEIPLDVPTAEPTLK